MIGEQYNITGKGVCDYAFGNFYAFHSLAFNYKNVGKENFFIERVAMAFPKDNPWIKHFDAEIRKIVQAGLIDRWKQVIFSFQLCKVILFEA